jgi:hypothetical protein
LTLGTLAPTGSVAVTLDGVTVNAPIAANGQFSATFATGSLSVANNPYAISFGYGGDTNFNGATGSSSLTVADTTPPAITGLTVDPSVLVPANHKMRLVTLTYQTSDNGPPPTVVLSVSSSEPVNGTGDGDTAPDWELVDATHVLLRAERSGNGTGRLYTIRVAATDASGNITIAEIVVAVPY